MKTVFIINPQAGSNNAESMCGYVKNELKKLGAEAQIYVTRCPGDATKYVKRFCEQNGGARFIACGGDGTLNEVINGALPYKNAEIGILPMGSGNDFCRNFGGLDFMNIENQLFGKTACCDAIKYTSSLGDKTISGFCANMINIGFDCNVADYMLNIKNNTIFSGSLAYFLSILVNLIKKKGADLKIELDGKLNHNGSLLLTSIANGSYCGGGIKSNPLANVDDGSININIIENLSRLKFLSLLPSYMKGTHVDNPKVKHIIKNLKCKKITITPNKGAFKLCCDGEILNAGKTELEIIHNAFNFVIPSRVLTGEKATAIT